jgi:hypothetical protein
MPADFADGADHEVLVDLPELFAHLNAYWVRVADKLRH